AENALVHVGAAEHAAADVQVAVVRPEDHPDRIVQPAAAVGDIRAGVGPGGGVEPGDGVVVLTGDRQVAAARAIAALQALELKPRSAVLRGAGFSRELEEHKCLLGLVREWVKTTSLPARRPSAGAMPGRCGTCLAAELHRLSYGFISASGYAGRGCRQSRAFPPRPRTR